MTLAEEFVPPCWVCGKIWQRKDAKDWYYFNGMIVCKTHKRAKKWYNGSLLLSEEKYLKPNGEETNEKI